MPNDGSLPNPADALQPLHQSPRKTLHPKPKAVRRSPVETFDSVIRPYLGTDGKSLPVHVVTIASRLLKDAPPNRRKRPVDAAGNLTKPHLLVLHFEDHKKDLVELENQRARLTGSTRHPKKTRLS